jgi:hypothetical protein
VKKLIKKSCLLLLFLFPVILISGKPAVVLADVHKFYISNTEVNYAEKERSLQITTRVFSNDFEKLLQTRYDNSIRLRKNESSENAELYIKRYFKEKFQIKLKGKIKPKNFIGKQFKENRTILYFEVENVSHFDKISIKNTILMDLFEQQKNMVHVTQNDETKTLVLVNDKSTGIFTFNN